MNDRDKSELRVPEESDRLRVIQRKGGAIKINSLLDFLKQDAVVLIQNVDPVEADRIVYEVADGFKLSEELQIQAGFAAFKGHRQSIGKHFMSVNKRDDYQFIPPHSEGSSFVGMQLASFYCFENTTDGGETILLNVDDVSTAWQSLREKVTRGRILTGRLANQEIARVRGLYGINLPQDLLKEDDQVLAESKSVIPNLAVFEVLAKPKKTYSRILNRDLYVYWDSVGSIDFDSASEFSKLLMHCGLLRQPLDELGLSRLDNAADRRVWRSGFAYSDLFRCKVTLKLGSGDLLIQNNLTWTHSASNWTPNSGRRKVAAAFA